MNSVDGKEDRGAWVFATEQPSLGDIIHIAQHGDWRCIPPGGGLVSDPVCGAK